MTIYMITLNVMLISLNTKERIKAIPLVTASLHLRPDIYYCKCAGYVSHPGIQLREVIIQMQLLYKEIRYGRSSVIQPIP